MTDLCKLLAAQQWRYADESDLQDAIAKLLTSHGLDYQREHHLTEKDIVDFMVGGIALEVKIKGSASAVIRQLKRYADCDSVQCIVLVTTRRLHAAKVPWQLSGKQVRTVALFTL